MKRRELLKTVPALVVGAQVSAMTASAQQVVAANPPKTPASYKGRLRPGVVAMSFRPQLETGKFTYEDVVRYAADYGLEGVDLTAYWVPPMLNFKPGIKSQEISEMVRQTPANPTNQWLASLRSTAHKNGVQIYTVGSPVKMAQATPELRQKEIAYGKKWVAIAEKLGAGQVRVFGGGIAAGATEAQAVEWAVEVYKPLLDYGAERGVIMGLENDDELTRTADQLFTILNKVKHPWAKLNLDCGNFRKDGYAESERCAPFAATTHIKTVMATPDGKREPADWTKLFGILANGGYRGFVSMEMEPYDAEGPVPKYAAELIRCARLYSGG